MLMIGQDEQSFRMKKQTDHFFEKVHQPNQIVSH
jgi:hypothetical protein